MFFFEYIEKNHKKMQVIEFSPENDYNDCDIINFYRPCGHDIYIKQSPENEELLHMVDLTEDYPLLSDEKYSEFMENYITEFFEDGTAQSLLKEKMTEKDKNLLTDLSCLPFKDIKVEKDENYFSDDYIVSENDIIEYTARSGEYRSDETMENFRKRVNEIAEQYAQKQTITIEPGF